jgi:hypothetical protein
VKPAPFIVGASRSGTTLLRMMLDAHPGLAIPPETHFIPMLSKVWEREPGRGDRVLDALVAHDRWNDFELEAGELRRRAPRSPTTLADLLRVFYSMYAERHGKARWGDKTPPYVLSMPVIAEVLPEAHFVHIIRDGRDVAISVRSLWFGPDSIEDAAAWWKERVVIGRRAGSTLSYTEVRYEDLVEDSRRELERLCRYIDLEFCPGMLVSHTRASERLRELKSIRGGEIPARGREEIHARLAVPPDSASVGRWRNEMTRDERRRFEQIAGDTLEELGYATG